MGKGKGGGKGAEEKKPAATTTAKAADPKAGAKTEAAPKGGKKAEMPALQNQWFMVGAAVVGMVSAAGMIIAQHYKQERRRHAMAQDLARLDQQLLGMRRQIEMLTVQQKKKLPLSTGSIAKPKKLKRSKLTSAASTATGDEYSSAVELDSSDLEFYDVSDDEEDENSRSSTVTPLDSILKNVDAKLDSGVPAEVTSTLDLLQDLCVEYPDSPDLLWRVGKAHHKICLELDDNVPVKLENISKGMNVCSEAIKLNVDCADAHKWYAILIGMRSDHQGIKDKVRDSVEFKRHLDKALVLKPEDPTLHHLLGRYSMEIASLKWYERKAVATLFAELPECTYEGAIQQLLNAEELGQKDWKENKLSLAKCYIALGEYSTAMTWLQDAQKITTKDDVDESIDVEVRSLLSKYNGYR